jgi:hypothetical protein
MGCSAIGTVARSNSPASTTRVVAFLSDTHLEPNFSVEFFRLAPAAPPEDDLES